MNRFTCRVVLGAVCIVGWDALVAAAPYPCVRAEEPIAIDGKMDDAAWQRAEPIIDFVLWWTADAVPTTKTVARLCYDDDHVYAFFVCEDPDLYAKYAKRDGYLWESDAVELFFQPDPACSMYYEIEVAPNEAVLDARLPRVGAPGGIDRWSKWNADIELAVRCNGTVNDGDDQDAGYTVELAIPRETFVEVIGDAPLEGQSWRFAVVRMELSTWEENAQLPLEEAKPGRERMSNVPCDDGNLHAQMLEPDGWATLVFK